MRPRKPNQPPRAWLKALARSSGIHLGTLCGRYRAGDRGERLTRPVIHSVALYRRRHPEDVLPLTPRHLEVVRVLCSGASNKQVAFTLGITQRAAEIHRANIMERTGCSKEIQLGMWAQRNRALWEVPTAAPVSQLKRRA